MDKSAFIEHARMSRRGARQAGMTLIELLVGMVVASLLSVGILAAMGFGVKQDHQDAQIAQLNDNARGALTLLTRDLQSAGFMFGSAQAQCAVNLNYDANQTPSYVQQYPLWAASQAAGQSLPYQTANNTYPPVANSNTGYAFESLMMTAAPSGSTYISQTSAPIYVVQFGTTQSGSGNGAISSTQLPVSTLQLNSTNGIQVGDMAYIQVPMNGGNVCMRVPITNVGSGTGSGATYVDSKGSSTPYMPSNGYNDYSAQIPSSYGTLTNGNLLHSRLIDLGQNSDTLDVNQYWIDASPGYPVLMRSTYSALTDKLVSQQAIAPGVVSLQILFGTVPQGTNPGTQTPAWKTWGDVLPSDQVVSAAVAMVIRSLHPDPSYAAPAVIVVPQPAAGLNSPDAFVNYIPQPSERQDHFAVFTTQVALRNLTWN